MNKTNGEFIITNDDPGYAVIFATYPAPYASVMGAIGDQVRDRIKGKSLMQWLYIVNKYGFYYC